MATIHLITGGSRSGKSRYGQELAESLPGRRVYVATCPVIDEEMRLRIARHQAQRTGRGWRTVEEPLDLAGVIARGGDGAEVLLVDCLTLWINNLLYRAQQGGRDLDEDEIAAQAGRVLQACGRFGGTVILVTNEVGMSIVPENALARRYRDLVGRCNQAIAAGADQVTLVACGCPLTLKRTTNIKEESE